MTKDALDSEFYAPLRRTFLGEDTVISEERENWKKKYSEVLLQTSELPASWPPIHSPFPNYLE